MPQAEADLEVIRAASSGGRGERDFSAVAAELREPRQHEEGSRS
jgi:hypothetical protein